MVGDTARAVAELAKAVPIYEDALQPAAKEAGKSLHLVTRAVNAALVPVEGLVWGVEKIRDFVHERVAKKLENVPPDEVQQPKPHIAVPTIEALRYTGEESDLSELYANLLATSMDRATAYRAHPSFVDMIKNMSPDEARIMRFLATAGSQPLINVRMNVKDGGGFVLAHRHLSLVGVKAECEHAALSPTYLDNLERLGLIQVQSAFRLKADELYAEIEGHPEVKAILDQLRDSATHIMEIDKIKLDITDLGQQFIKTCVIDKASQVRS